MSLDKATAKIKELAAGNGGAIGKTVKFVFAEGVVFLDDTKSPTAVSNEDAGADCTIRIDLKDFLKMLDGDLDPMSAYMGGMMKIDGDITVALKLTSIF